MESERDGRERLVLLLYSCPLATVGKRKVSPSGTRQRMEVMIPGAWRELKREYVGYALSYFPSHFFNVSRSPFSSFSLCHKVPPSYRPFQTFASADTVRSCRMIDVISESCQELPSFVLSTKKKNFSRTQQARLSIAHLSWRLTGCGKPRWIYTMPLGLFYAVDKNLK